jgi:hypothetical protein
MGRYSDEVKEKILQQAAQFSDDLKLVRVFEKDDYVYEVIY